MKDMLVSVIVPVYNAENTVERCIKSILRQTYENIEIIVIDDGSSDNTNFIVKNLLVLDSRIKLIRINNSGVSFSRNIGLKESIGEFVMFVDADDFISCNMIEILVFSIENTNADVSICKFKVLKNEENYSENSLREIKLMSKNEYIQEMLLPNMKIAAFVWNRLYRKNIIEKNNIFFDETIFVCEDLLFNYLYAEHSERFVICSDTLYYYCINTESTMYKKFFNRKKFTASKVFRYIIEQINIEQKKVAEISAALFFELLYFQSIKYRYKLSVDEKMHIRRYVNIKTHDFWTAKISIKYKIFFSIIKFFGGVIWKMY